MNGAGLYLAYKPRGATSFSLVRTLQERLQNAGEPLPVCHGGALDPFAEGLLLLLAGPATRLMEELHPIPKYYEAELSWGTETDTGDPGGETIFRGDASTLTPEKIEAALQDQLGWRDQVPPATSNKRIGGEPAWKKAKRGEEVVLPPSRVYLHSARFLEHRLPGESTLALCCRGGYYVRSLARELGRALGCGAHLRSLRRTQIGPWRDPGNSEPSGSLSNSITGLPKAGEPWIAAAPIAGAALLPWLPSRALGEAEAIQAELKRAIPRGEIKPGEFALPGGFPGPGMGERDRVQPIRGLAGETLRVLLREKNGALALHTDLGGGL